MTQPIRIAVVGCGNISIYFENLPRFVSVQVVACADLDLARAQATALEHKMTAGTLEEVLRDSNMDLVLNLTTPDARLGRGIRGARGVQTRLQPKAVGARTCSCTTDARAKNLRVGCAPDTFPGGGLQTCRDLIDAGAIGIPAWLEAGL